MIGLQCGLNAIDVRLRRKIVPTVSILNGLQQCDR